MTVAELITKLMALPESAQVATIVVGDYNETVEIETVTYERGEVVIEVDFRQGWEPD